MALANAPLLPAVASPPPASGIHYSSMPIFFYASATALVTAAVCMVPDSAEPQDFFAPLRNAAYAIGAYSALNLVTACATDYTYKISRLLGHGFIAILAPAVTSATAYACTFEPNPSVSYTVANVAAIAGPALVTVASGPYVMRETVQAARSSPAHVGFRERLRSVAKYLCGGERRQQEGGPRNLGPTP